MMKPIDPIAAVFRQKPPALMPYYTLGYPDLDTSIEIIERCAAAGAPLMELGIPFSDPLADGPTIQHSTQVALEKGITVAQCLAAVRQLRRRGVEIPFLLMGYLNPILAYGTDRFVEEAARSGVNGLIIPDLPPDEAGELQQRCRKHGLALVFLLAPNSPSERIQLVCEHSTGFTYLVSVTGITGARSQLPPGLVDFVERVRSRARTPLAVGFGISTPDQAAAVGALVEGVIVGSALIKAVDAALERGEDPAHQAGAFVVEMLSGLKGTL